MDLIAFLNDLMAQVPALLQPVVVAAAGAIPFVEGEGAVALGVFSGLHPVAAGTAAAVGNFLAVLVVVLLGVRARRAVTDRSRARTSAHAAEPAMAANAANAGTAGAVGAPLAGGAGEVAAAGRDGRSSDRKAARRAKFQKAYERYGVPGVSLLGPLLLPTHITAGMLAASGVGAVRVLVWQAAAIVVWTTITALVVTGVLVAVR